MSSSLRILVAHNFYSSRVPSGENRVVEQEIALLRSKGHLVRSFERHNDKALSGGFRGTMEAAASSLWNPVSAREIRGITEEFKPDVLHVHNMFPLISPSIFSAASNVARVFTLHNYRIFCAEGTTTRMGLPCTQCIDKRSSWPALKYGCYRKSRLATAPVAAGIALHRGLHMWRQEVDAYIALTAYQRERMVSGGLPAEKMWVKPNFFSGAPSIVPWANRAMRAVYAGRMSAEKGVEELVGAWLLWGSDAPDLVLLGDGPLRAELEGKVRDARAANIIFRGQVDARSAHDLIGASRMIILPSRVAESFGLSILDGFALGTPLLVSDRGALPTLVGDAGFVFRTGDVIDLLQQAKALWSKPGVLERMSMTALEKFHAEYTEDTNYRLLMDVYSNAIRVKESRA